MAKPFDSPLQYIAVAIELLGTWHPQAVIAAIDVLTELESILLTAELREGTPC